MTDHDRADIIAVLDEVRIRLEAAANPAEAGSPIHKSWQLVAEAIDNLRSIEVATGTPDDLTAIRGISTELAQRLISLGVVRYANIAAWGPADVRSISQALGLTREIHRENWIEQAALLQRRKSGGEIAVPFSPAAAWSSDQVASVEKPDDPPVPATVRQIDLPDILEAIRKDALIHDQTPTTSESAASGADPVAVSIEREDAALASSAPGAEPVEQAEAAAIEIEATQKREPRIPTVTASAHVSVSAEERAQRLEEERQRQARNLDAGDLPSGEVGEAAVTFIIREPVRPTQSLPEQTTPRKGAKLLDRNQRTNEGTDSEPYLAINPPEEAEVVVVKPQAQLFGPVARPERGVRRFLRALRGG